MAGGLFGAVVHAAPDPAHGGRGSGCCARRGAPGLGGGLPSLAFPCHHAPCPSTCTITPLISTSAHAAVAGIISVSRSQFHPLVCAHFPGSLVHELLRIFQIWNFISFSMSAHLEETDRQAISASWCWVHGLVKDDGIRLRLVHGCRCWCCQRR